MNIVLDLFTKREILIVGVVLGTLVFIVLVLTIWDIISKRKKENMELDEAFLGLENDSNTSVLEVEPSLIKKIDRKPLEMLELKKVDNVETNSEIETQDLKSTETVNTSEILEIENEVSINEVENSNSISITELESSETNVENLDINISKLKNDTKEIKLEKTINLEPIIIDDDEVDVSTHMDSKVKAQEELLKIEAALEHPKTLEDTLYNLEKVEEENAIISYQELLENTRELKIVDDDIENEPISLTEILSMYEPKSEETPVTAMENAYNGEFTSSPYLSPIMGVEHERVLSKSLAEIQLENTANLEKLEKEIRKTNEFLNILNDLKKNLE